MSIFEKDEPKSDGKLRVQIFSKGGNMFVMRRGWAYNLAPPPTTQANLSPVILGVDVFLKEGSKIKGLGESFVLASSTEWFLGCDARIEFEEILFDGWTYSLYPESLSVKNFHKVWVCQYLKFFFDNPPPKLFLSLE
jgi:hypothetical protein